MARFARIVLVAFVVSGSVVLTLDAPASAAPLPAAYSASAGADIVRINALSEIGGAPSTLANVGVADSLSTANSAATPRSTAIGSNITLAAPIAGLTVNRLQRTAPPNQPTATTQLLAVNQPTLAVDAVSASVHAQWAGDSACPAAGSPLATTTAETARAAVGIPGGLPSNTENASNTKPSGPMFENVQTNAAPAAARADVNFPLLVTGVGSTGGTTSLISVPGPRDSRAVRAVATASVGSISLGGGFIEVGIAGDPSLTATATGNAATSTLTYVPPTLSVVVEGNPTLIPAGGTLVIPAEGETVTLSVGRLTDVVNTGTVVSGQASVFSLTLSGVLDGSFDVAPMAVRAAISSTGIQCIAPVVAPPTTPTPLPTTSGPILAATGSGRVGALSLLALGLIVTGASVLMAAGSRTARHGRPMNGARGSQP